jgi:hypothetical protein
MKVRGNRRVSKTNSYSLILPLSRDGERKEAFTPCILMGPARKVDKTKWH